MVEYSSTSLDTSLVSLVSHTHGRQRRLERGIQRRDLQAAIRHGKKESANPGPQGEERWRYTHNGVVYITDKTSRHEITSWRVEGGRVDSQQPSNTSGLSVYGAHFVLIVDHSGSMRKADVPGYTSRTEAVYENLVRNLLEPQVKQGYESDQGNAVVTLIEMSSDAKVLLMRQPINKSLVEKVKYLGTRRPRSHGNYLPALDKAEEVLLSSCQDARLMLVFLSDGAPSDHIAMQCTHGVQVWMPEDGGGTTHHGKQKLQYCCYGGSSCRQATRTKVNSECQKRIVRIGNRFGKDRVVVSFCGFGSPNEDFTVLKQMASKLPRGSFNKLGLRGDEFRTVFSSLSSSLSSLRTESTGGRRPLTLRENVTVRRENVNLSSQILRGSGWHVCTNLAKFQYGTTQSFRLMRVSFQADGIAFRKVSFACGAERLAHRGSEIRLVDGCFRRTGPWLVTKQSKFEELLYDETFHETFCRLHYEAQGFALAFNQDLCLTSDFHVSFLQCAVYKCKMGDQYLTVLAEPELEGKYEKYNNNAGRAYHRPETPRSGGHDLLEILEEEDEDDDYDEEIEGNVSFQAEDVPECFSHYTLVRSGYEKLICDLQGVRNDTDGFMLTDPVIHLTSSSSSSSSSGEGRSRNGATDKGVKGIKLFLESHRCSALCRKLGLPSTEYCSRMVDAILAWEGVPPGREILLQNHFEREEERQRTRIRREEAESERLRKANALRLRLEQEERAKRSYAVPEYKTDYSRNDFLPTETVQTSSTNDTGCCVM